MTYVENVSMFIKQKNIYMVKFILIILCKHALISMFLSRNSIDEKTKNLEIGDENFYTLNLINLLFI